MKTLLIVSAALGAVALAACGNGAVAFSAHDDDASVSIKDAVARVNVIVEDRADVAVEVSNAAGLPALQVRKLGDRIEVDGDLRRRIQNCESGGVSVRGHGQVAFANAPVITIRSPRKVSVNAGGAVSGQIGAGATDISLGSAGCGDWTVADASGAMSLSLAGSGDIKAGASRSLSANLAGSGDIRTGATRTLSANIAGSGDIEVARVDGPVDANIAGSGDIKVLAGEATKVDANIMGSGDVEFAGRAGSADANVMGSGNVRIAQVSGAIDRHVAGSGRVIVGQ